MNWLNFAAILSEIKESLVGDFVALQFFFLEDIVGLLQRQITLWSGYRRNYTY